jgi:hypothetical protein
VGEGAAGAPDAREQAHDVAGNGGAQEARTDEGTAANAYLEEEGEERGAAGVAEGAGGAAEPLPD